LSATAIDHIECCVFDAYGTLFDIKAAAGRCRDELGGKAGELAALWRNKQLEYSWLRSLMEGQYRDFWSLTGDALDYAMSALGLANPALREKLMGLYRELDAYPDAAPALAALRQAGYRTAILSNGSPAMLDAAVASAGIGHLLDMTLSVDSLGIFKPHPSVYRLAVDALGVAAPSGICFQSSNGWDISGAAVFGYRTVWINRYGQPRDILPGAPDAEIKSLAELPRLLAG